MSLYLDGDLSPLARGPLPEVHPPGRPCSFPPSRLRPPWPWIMDPLRVFICTPVPATILADFSLHVDNSSETQTPRCLDGNPLPVSPVAVPWPNSLKPTAASPRLSPPSSLWDLQAPSPPLPFLLSLDLVSGLWRQEAPPCLFMGCTGSRLVHVFYTLPSQWK